MMYIVNYGIGILLVAAVLGFCLGCYNPVIEPLPTYTPYPTPEARVVVATPTPSPAEDWMCFTGKIQVVQGTKWDSTLQIGIIGEQVVCAKDWRISNLYGPVGSLESDPEKPLKFKDLRKSLEAYQGMTNKSQ